MSLAFLPLKILLVGLDLLISLLTFQWLGIIKKLLRPAALRSVPVADNPAHRVPTKFKDSPLNTPYPSVSTLHELFQYAAKRFGSRHAMGQREFLGMHTPKIKKFGSVAFRTYEQVNDAALKFGASLRSAGLVASPPKATLDQLNTPCTLAIFENTCPEWMIAALGAFSQSISVTTVYSTLGIDAVVDSINDGRIRAILCNKRNVALLVGKIQDMPTLKHIIYTNDAIAPGETVEIPASPGDVTISSFEEFVNAGDTKAFSVVPPTKDTCAVIMYTSGSTGKPKGVVVTHANVLASTTMVTEIINSDDVFLAYLPLAHIFELVAEISCLSCGVCICYADPRTLTATGSYPIGALEAYRPTLLVGVPKIWDVIKKGAEAKIMAGSKLSRFIVATAFEARARARKLGFDTPLFNALVFKKFSKLVGGRLRLAVSGGGPLSSDVQTFITTCFGAWLGQGYGLTETCAGLTLQDLDDDRTGIAGFPIPCVEVKLVSCPDINDKAGLPYLSTDRKDVHGNSIHGRGEVWVKGACVGLGYYMMEDKTKEDFDEDGFFHTGDIGQFTEDGSVQIVDRKKNLIKLKGGEYIAVENMEMTYANCTFVDAAAGGICCYGDGDMDRPIAIMQLNPVIVKNWAKENGLEGNVETLKDSKELYDAVMNEMEAIHKRSGLSHIEKLVAVAFVTEHWTPENGCLTAANKLQRRAVVEKHDAVFQQTKKRGIF
ncbi:hypothetical protein ACHAW6_004640 [Cyclotella cf. meneghiniana]